MCDNYLTLFTPALSGIRAKTMAWIAKDRYGYFLYKEEPSWNEETNEWITDNPSWAIHLKKNEVFEFFEYNETIKKKLKSKIAIEI